MPIEYMARRIEGGYLDYTAVITRYPAFKDGIDLALIRDGFEYLIV